MKTLLIDTSSNKIVVVGLRIGDKEDVIEYAVGVQKAQVVLSLIETLLKRNKLTLQDVTDIQVALGPGSFTGLRVGVSIANTLGYSLQVPINGKKIGEFVEPTY